MRKYLAAALLCFVLTACTETGDYVVSCGGPPISEKVMVDTVENVNYVSQNHGYIAVYSAHSDGYNYEKKYPPYCNVYLIKPYDR